MSIRRRIRSFMLRHFPNRISDETRAELVSEAANRLVAGVTMTPDEWESMSEAEQAAYIVAGKAIAAASAAQLGIATLGLDEADRKSVV